MNDTAPRPNRLGEAEMQMRIAKMEQLRSSFISRGISVENLEIDILNRVIGYVMYSGCKVRIILEMDDTIMIFHINMSIEYVRQFFEKQIRGIQEVSDDDIRKIAVESERCVTMGRSDISSAVRLVTSYCSKLSEALGKPQPIRSLQLPGMSVEDRKKRDLMTLLTKLEMAVDWAEKCRKDGFIQQETLAKLRKWYEQIKRSIKLEE